MVIVVDSDDDDDDDDDDDSMLDEPSMNTYTTAPDIVVSPEDIGIPVGGSRRLSNWNLGGTTKFREDAATYMQKFQQIVMADPTVYLLGDEAGVAPASKRSRTRSATAQSSSSIAVDEASQGDSFAYVTSSRRAHIEGHWLACIKKRLCSPEGDNWTVGCAIVNLQNTADYSSSVATEVMPRVLTTSVLYDLVSQRPLSLSEIWLIQGFAHPDAAASVEAKSLSRFPCAKLVGLNCQRHEMLTATEQRALVGNSIHQALMESWLLHAFTSTLKILPAADLSFAGAGVTATVRVEHMYRASYEDDADKLL